MALVAPSADGAYVALPQAPDAADVEHMVIPTALDVEEPEELEEAEDAHPHAPVILDARIRWIYFILGNAVLLPWNAMIVATPYFLSRLTPTLRSTFNSYLSLTFTVANVVFLARATATSSQATNGPSRVRNTLLCLVVLIFLLLASTYFKLPAGVFFAFILVNAVVQSAAGAYLQTAVIAVASLFGPVVMQALMFGQAGVGVLISAVQLFSTLGSIHSEQPRNDEDDAAAAAKSAFAFFGLSTLFLVGALVSHIWLVTLPGYKAVAQQYHQRRTSLSLPFGRSVSPHERQGLVPTSRTPDKTAQIKRVLKSNIVYEAAVAYVFTVTLSVFPVITVSVKPFSTSLHPLIFTAVHFLVFNLGDFFGRSLCSFPRLLVWSDRRLLLFSLARTLFIPLFLACNIQRPTPTPTLPAAPVIGSDVLFMLILLLFGLSNGYVSTMCMVAAPSVDHNPRLKGRREDVDTAATVASFCLVGGLTCGSLVSFAVRASICQCNPLSG